MRAMGIFKVFKVFAYSAKCRIKTLRKIQLLKGKSVFVSNNGTEFDNSTSFQGQNTVGSHSILNNVKMGYGSYIGKYCRMRNVAVGKFCSIANNVITAVGKHPTKQFVSTHPAFYSTELENFNFVKKQKFEEWTYLNSNDRIQIIIGNDVWIADNVTIVENVSIGDGAIVAAGAVVTENVPPFAIVGGVPARVIRYRFNSDQIEFLENIKWWDRPLSWIKENAELFEDIDLFIDTIKSLGGYNEKYKQS